MLEKFVENVGGCLQDNRFQVNKTVSKLITRGSLLYEKPDRKRTVLTEQKVDTIRAGLETSPRNLLNVCTKKNNIFTSANVQRIAVPGLKKRDRDARILSGITQNQHPQRDFNNFRRITPKLNRFPRLYSVHSVRTATFSPAAIALLYIC